jgi:hypothetical protein
MFNIVESDERNYIIEEPIDDEDIDFSFNNKNEIDITIDIYEDKGKEKNIQSFQTLQGNKTNETYQFHSRGKFSVTKNENEGFGLIGKKRKKLNDKGNRQDTMINRYKLNFFAHLQIILYKMIENSKLLKFFKLQKINFKRISKKKYMIFKASENLKLLEKKLKDVLSEDNLQNEELINSIYEAYDLHLIDILNKTIKELMDIYRGKSVSKEYYYIELANYYKKFLRQLEEEKVETYIEKFKKCANNFEDIYEKKKTRNKKNRNN